MTNVIYLASNEEDFGKLDRYPATPARLNYRFSPELRLLRAGGETLPQGGLMVLSDADCAPQTAATAPLCRQIAAECAARHFSGVVADFTGPRHPTLQKLCAELERTTREAGLSYFVSENYQGMVTEANVLVPCQIHTGSLREYLERQKAQFGGRAALDLGRMCHDFSMSRGGQGIPLTRDDMRLLRVRYRPMAFYSRELFSNYFTYRDPQGGMHFVMFDDATTLKNKLILAQSLGYEHIFLLYSEVEEFLPRLLP